MVMFSKTGSNFHSVASFSHECVVTHLKCRPMHWKEKTRHGMSLLVLLENIVYCCTSRGKKNLRMTSKKQYAVFMTKKVKLTSHRQVGLLYDVNCHHTHTEQSRQNRIFK